MTENRRSVLDKATVAHELQKKEKEKEKLLQERRRLAESFAQQIKDLIWKYGPVKIRNYSLSYSYPYLEPGTIVLPQANIAINGLEISAYVEVEFGKHPSQNVNSDSVVAKKVSLVISDADSTSDITVSFEQTDASPSSMVFDSLPDKMDLVVGAEVLSALKTAYEHSGLREAPTGHADYH